MASRTKQKEEARQRRLAQEQESALKARRTRRLQMVGGLVAGVVVVVVVLAVAGVFSSSGSKGKAVSSSDPAAKAAAATVSKELQGIPQTGTTLGSPKAPVTMVEYGDLACPVCRDFALGGEQQLIAKDVRQGKVKIQYKALETASQEANDAMFVPSQMAARAAGKQQKGWNYIELFYHLQQDETKSYVTTPFLQSLAKLIPGLDYAGWNSARTSSTYKSQVLADESAAQQAGFQSTPTMIFQGPVAQSKPIAYAAPYSVLEKTLKSVSPS